jgi:NAD-dependent DNA ligase
MTDYSDFDKTGLSVLDCIKKLQLDKFDPLDHLAGDLVCTVQPVDLWTDLKKFSHDFVNAGSIMMLLSFETDNRNDVIYAKLLHNERILYTADLSKLFYVEHGTSLEGKSFCFTGKLRHIRDYYATLVSFQGGKFKKNINKDLDYLVCGEDVGRNKTESAKHFGVKRISEAELLSLISAGKKKV